MPTELTTTEEPRRVQASEFKSTCLKLMDEVYESGEEIVVTKHGTPVVRVSPYRARLGAPWGRDKGKLEILGDIISPIDVEWEAISNPDRGLDPTL